MITRNDIHTFLKGEDIAPDATVLVHTSMRALGEVEGGCDGLIDAFTSYLTDGLFIVPTHTWATVGREHPVFDSRTERPCIGALPTVAAFRKDSVRSLHPTHSVAAFGKRAEQFVKGEEGSHSPCPAGGVWARLYDERATILLLGVDLTKNTYFHAVDEMLDLPDRLVPPIDLTVIDREGIRHEVKDFCKHGAAGSEYFENYRKPLVALGAFHESHLGDAVIGVCDAVRSTEVLRLLWSRADYNLTGGVREIPEEYYI